MGQSLFIVWRESVEALLVIGILYAWLRRQPDNRRALVLLWGGVGLGLVFSALLALLILRAGEWLAGSAGEWFQAALVLVASGLILQMVGWMHRHGRQLRDNLIAGASAGLSQRGGLGLLVLALIAVGREGSETVVFLYGIGAQQQGLDLGRFALGGLLGFVLAVATFAALQLGSRLLSWRRFFQLSETLLLLLGAALLMAGLDRVSGQLMGMDLPEVAYSLLGEALWDSSAILDDGSGVGAVLAGFTGYRAMPSPAAVGLMAAYWMLVWLWLWRPQPALARVSPA